MPFATYHLSATLIAPTNFKKQKEILKSSQLTKQGTQFTFSELPCQNKDHKSSALLGGLNHCFIKERTEQPASHTGPWSPASPGNAAQASTGMPGRAAGKQIFLCRVPQSSCLTQSSAFHLRFALLEVNGVSRNC